MIETIAILLLVGLDQLIKYLVRTRIPLGGHVDFIPYVLDLTHLRNSGAAFSVLSGGGARWFFVVLTVAFVGFAMWVLYAKKLTHPMGRWALAGIVAGAVGNLIDRALFGYVVDMFETLFISFPVFNVADIYVTVCGVLKRQEKKQQKRPRMKLRMKVLKRQKKKQQKRPKMKPRMKVLKR